MNCNEGKVFKYTKVLALVVTNIVYTNIGTLFVYMA